MLNDYATSPELIRHLEEVVRLFVGKEALAVDRDPQIAMLPNIVQQFYALPQKFPDMMATSEHGFGKQDHLHYPPKPATDNSFRLISENQHQFHFEIQSTELGDWVAWVDDGERMRDIDSLAGYLVSFALQEMIFSAPLWALDEGMDGHAKNLTSDAELLWSDHLHGQYNPYSQMQFYRLPNNALLMSDDEGRGYVGSHDLSLKGYFEKMGFYDIR